MPSPTSPPTLPRDNAQTRAEDDLISWRQNFDNRDHLILAAMAVGIEKTRIAGLTGIARTTIDQIIKRALVMTDPADTLTTTLVPAALAECSSNAEVVEWLDTHRVALAALPPRYADGINTADGTGQPSFPAAPDAHLDSRTARLTGARVTICDTPTGPLVVCDSMPYRIDDPATARTYAAALWAAADHLDNPGLTTNPPRAGTEIVTDPATTAAAKLATGLSATGSGAELLDWLAANRIALIPLPARYTDGINTADGTGQPSFPAAPDAHLDSRTARLTGGRVTIYTDTTGHQIDCNAPFMLSSAAAARMLAAAWWAAADHTTRLQGQ